MKNILQELPLLTGEHTLSFNEMLLSGNTKKQLGLQVEGIYLFVH